MAGSTWQPYYAGTGTGRTWTALSTAITEFRNYKWIGDDSDKAVEGSKSDRIGRLTLYCRNKRNETNKRREET